MSDHFCVFVCLHWGVFGFENRSSHIDFQWSTLPLSNETAVAAERWKSRVQDGIIHLQKRSQMNTRFNRSQRFRTNRRRKHTWKWTSNTSTSPGISPLLNFLPEWMPGALSRDVGRAADCIFRPWVAEAWEYFQVFQSQNPITFLYENYIKLIYKHRVHQRRLASQADNIDKINASRAILWRSLTYLQWPSKE